MRLARMFSLLQRNIRRRNRSAFLSRTADICPVNRNKGIAPVPAHPVGHEHLGDHHVHIATPAGSLSQRLYTFLLKRVKPLRKAAGGVRDMDVMIAKVLSVADGMGGDRRDALLRLTGQMSAVRERNAERLRRLIERRGKTLCSKLKSYASRMGKAEPDELGVSMAAPQMLTAQLQHWPRLRAGNLHEFRIQAKELRYMLQLMPEMDEHTLNAFARVKDVAGEWHDWLQVHEYAGKVLDAKEDHEILRRLGEIEHEKLRAALVTANAIRHNGLAAL